MPHQFTPSQGDVDPEQLFQENAFLKLSLRNSERVWAEYFHAKESKLQKVQSVLRKSVDDHAATQVELYAKIARHQDLQKQLVARQKLDCEKYAFEIGRLEANLKVAKKESDVLANTHLKEIERTHKQHLLNQSLLNSNIEALKAELINLQQSNSLQKQTYEAQLNDFESLHKEVASRQEQVINDKNNQLVAATRERAIERQQLEAASATIQADQLQLNELLVVNQNYMDAMNAYKFELNAIKAGFLWKRINSIKVFLASVFPGLINPTAYPVYSPGFQINLPVNNESDNCVLNNSIGSFNSTHDHAIGQFNKKTLEVKKMKNVNDLLGLYGELFLTNAYHIILGRNPDPAGLAHYMQQLKSGVSKVELLSQLSASKEARKIASNFPGLHEIVRRHKLSKSPLMGWYKPDAEKIERRLNTIENRLFEFDTASSSKTLDVLEAEIAQHAEYVQDKEMYIAKLLKNAASITDLTWDQFNTQILAHRKDYKGVFVQEIIIDWDVPLYQRPQHIASALGRLGYLVIYRTANWTSDQVVGFRQVVKNVWLTAAPEVDMIEGAVHSFYSTAFSIPPELISQRKVSHGVIYEYIDHIDPQISGDAENIKRLHALKDFAFNGGADFIVASAKLLEREAISAVGKSKVVLAQNGVDTRHYRNPVHATTPLPDDLIVFRAKYSNLIGYFGALAPWLWYETITELVEARPDLGFVFIGPDYYGGAEKLPKSANVLYLGTVDYKILPAYAGQFDVCFIPFAPSEIARTTSPLKLFEYFALEKPVVVTSEMVECVAFPEVFRGDSASTLSQAIDAAIAVKSDPAFKSRLASLADENDWDERAKAMEVVFAAKSQPNFISLDAVQKMIVDGHLEDKLGKNYYKDAYSKEEE